MATNAILYNKKKPLLQVRLEKGAITELGELRDPEFLPIVLQNKLDLESINKWLSKRRIPDNREGLKDLRLTYGSFENYRNMFSLTDQYWFRRNKNESWEKLNFFTHKYSNALGEALFMPWMARKDTLSEQGPDLTTNGVLRKVWVQDEDLTSYLIKAGSTTFHQEPLSEVLASMTLAKLNLVPYVRYELAIYGLRIVSKCKCFVDKNTEFVPAQAIYSREPRRANETIYEHFLAMCDKFHIHGAKDYMDGMILSDMIIGNDDRHMGNFGLLRNVETGKFIGFAPLFDFGSAFHEFFEDSSEKSRMFESEQERVLKKYMNRLPIKALKQNQELFLVIDKYPGLSREQKERVKAGIMARCDILKVKEKKKDLNIEH